MQSLPSRAEALRKLLTLGELVHGEIVEVMGGDAASVQVAMHELQATGVLTYRNCGRGQRLYCLASDCGRRRSAKVGVQWI